MLLFGGVRLPILTALPAAPVRSHRLPGAMGSGWFRTGARCPVCRRSPSVAHGLAVGMPVGRNLSGHIDPKSLIVGLWA